MSKLVSVKEAAQLLLNGELVALPTETVYGLAACYDNPQAIDALFTTKGRPNTNPLIVHVSSIKQALSLCATVPEKAMQLMEHFWPGPLTLVLPVQAHISKKITAGQKSIALRMPNHPDFLETIRATGKPLAAPSANPSNRISPTNASMVADYFPNLPLVDGGNCTCGLESTIIGFQGDKLICFRPGSIPLEVIEARTDQIINENPANLVLPGMHQVHYSPNAIVELTSDLSETLTKEKFPNGIVVITQSSRFLASIPFESMSLSLNGELEHVAQNLYSVLYQVDKKNPPRILVELAQNQGLGMTINNRLYRAAGITPN